MISFVALFAAVVLIARSFRRHAGLAPRQRLLRRLAGSSLVAVAVVAAPTGLILSKTIARSLLPLGLLWLAVVFITVLRLVVDDRRNAMKSGALALALTLLGNEWIGQGMMQLLEAPFQGDPFAEAPLDAVVVLGGGAQQAPHPGFELGPSGDRIYLGARLYFARRTPLLVTTGTPIEGFQVPFDSLEATAKLWRDIGVPDEAIVKVTGTRTTGEEARQVALLIRERGWRRVGLVTSAWHLRRATGLFARELRSKGLADAVVVVPLAADHRGTPTWEGLYSLVPTGNGAYLQQKAAWEWIGAAVGR